MQTGSPTGADDDAVHPSRLDPLLAFEALLNNTTTIVVVFDGQLIVTAVSQAAAKLARRPRRELLGRHVLELQDFPPSFRAELERVLLGDRLEDVSEVPREMSREQPWVRRLLLPICDAEGTVQGGMVVCVDITEQVRVDERLDKLSHFNPVTGLPNRVTLTAAMERAMGGRGAERGRLALIWANLDRFKDVNDAWGPKAGDELLRAVGVRLQESVRTSDLVAHVGADDFLLLLAECGTRAQLDRLMARIRRGFNAPYLLEGESVTVSASCGVSVCHDSTVDAQELQEQAHSAMRVAKRQGGGVCELHDSLGSRDARQRIRLAGEIRDGIEQGRHFVPYYQPQVCLGTMRVQAVEALARWEHTERGLLLPSDFISFAEETGLIVTLGRSLLSQACSHLKEWHEALESAPRLAFNISARSIQRSDLCGDVWRAVRSAGLSFSWLEFEITETTVFADPERTAQVATCLRELGASVALDDFGTGYSSLTHLRELPIDRVKIDRSFVANCVSDHSAAAILSAVTDLAHDLGMEVIAEGVETQAQLDYVLSAGCDAAQGYLLSMPLPLEDCTAFLLQSERLPQSMEDRRGITV